MNRILEQLNSRKYSNRTYSVVKINNFYVIKQYVNGTENKNFNATYKTKSDVTQHLKNILKYEWWFKLF